MIYTVVVERKNGIDPYYFGDCFNHQWTEIHKTILQARNRSSELNMGWLKRKILNHRAFFQYRQDEEVLGTWVICSVVVLVGSEHDDPDDLFDYPTHSWCIKSLDSRQDLYPTYRESIQ